MGTQAVSVYQQVIEKTKGLSFRSQMLALNIDKKFGNRDKDNVSNNFTASLFAACLLFGNAGKIVALSYMLHKSL